MPGQALPARAILRRRRRALSRDLLAGGAGAVQGVVGAILQAHRTGRTARQAQRAADQAAAEWRERAALMQKLRQK